VADTRKVQYGSASSYHPDAKKTAQGLLRNASAYGIIICQSSKQA